jgi:sec-independent protein translocase protein TatC
MSSPEEQKGAKAPNGGAVPSPDQPAEGTAAAGDHQAADHQPEVSSGSSYSYDDYPYEDHGHYESSTTPAEPITTPAETTTAVVPAPATGGSSTPPPSAGSGNGGGGGDDDDDDGMLRMSFLEHLEELRTRIIRALMGVAVAFALSLVFTNDLWSFVCQPAVTALKNLGYRPFLVQITPMESFNVIWVKLPILCAIFMSSPWILYQVWAFIAPGLYKKERRWAVPFVLTSAGLFIAGGLFAYFVAFRFGLTFLLSIGRGNYVEPMVSITEYFDLFVNVIMGVGLVFELPVLIFFLTLLRIVTPKFLLNNSRYAILIIFVLAAIVTPTPDVFNLMLFAAPMCLLFYVGIFAGYLLVLEREGRRFPWKPTLTVVGIVVLTLAAVIYLAITKYGFKLVPHWPFLSR